MQYFVVVTEGNDPNRPWLLMRTYSKGTSFKDWVDSTEQRWVTQQTVRYSASVVWGASRLFCPVVPLRTPMGGGSLLFTTVVSPYRYIFVTSSTKLLHLKLWNTSPPKVKYILVVITSPCVWSGTEWSGLITFFFSILLLRTRVTEGKCQRCLQGFVARITQLKGR